MASGMRARISIQVTRPGIISRMRCESLLFATGSGSSARGTGRTAEESRAVASLTLEHRRHPVAEFQHAATHCVEVGLADQLGHGADAAIAHRPVIHRRDGGNLRARTAEESLVSDVQLAAVYVALLDRDPQVSGDLDDAAPGDP